MSNTYSAHPALASEQLQQAASEAAGSVHSHSRRHNANAIATSSGRGLSKPAKAASNLDGSTTVLGSRAKCSTAVDVVEESDEARHRQPEPRTELNTKDCVDMLAAPPVASIDEPDYLQHRFSRTHELSSRQQYHHHHHQHQQEWEQHEQTADVALSDAGCVSGLSSIVSSPSPSTVSSPLSTPTRLAPHLQQQDRSQPHRPLQLQLQLCCPKTASGGAAEAAAAAAATTAAVLAAATSADSDSASSAHVQHHHHHDHEHHHHHHHHHHNPMAAAAAAAPSSCGSAAGSKQKLQKFDPRLGPSRYRQLLPIAMCLLSFATVFSILIVYMDTTEIRHQQFRLNMSRDYELYGVAQDDPQLIAFLREIHMRKYPMHFFKNRAGSGSGSGNGGGDGDNSAASGGGVGGVGSQTLNGVDQHLNFSAHPNELTPKMAHYVADLLGTKTNGAVIQSLPGPLGHLMTAPWLSETLNWAGVIVEPEPRRYFTLRKQNALRPRMQVVHACVSPNPYPKEVTIHNEESEVRINSLLDEETSWFNSRVKCFPLYTIMLASNRVEYDLLSLGVRGHELEILQTLPFDKIKIEVISIHLVDDQEDVRSYTQSITKFLLGKSYKMQKKFGRNYFYQRIGAASSRTRKKDILLLKTP